MIFIVGGAYQGKMKYAGEMFGNDYRIINAYHLTVKKQLNEKKEPMAEAAKLLEEAGQQGSLDRLVVISDELGCGLVPVDAFEREYREVNGRVNCYFAAEAESVIRVICGIGQKIK